MDHKYEDVSHIKNNISYYETLVNNYRILLNKAKKELKNDRIINKMEEIFNEHVEKKYNKTFNKEFVIVVNDNNVLYSYNDVRIELKGTSSYNRDFDDVDTYVYTSVTVEDDLIYENSKGGRCEGNFSLMDDYFN